MMKIKFEVNGRPVDPRNLKNVLEQALLRQFEEHLREQIGSIRDPETGEFPTVVVSGDSLERMSIRAEGSPALIALIQKRLGREDIDEEEEEHLSMSETPRAFLSYGWEDRSLAEKIATAMQANGIDTWWAEWCIRPGDSLRRKIDEGLGDCTHFIVLMTPTSIKNLFAAGASHPALAGMLL